MSTTDSSSTWKFGGKCLPLLEQQTDLPRLRGEARQEAPIFSASAGCCERARKLAAPGFSTWVHLRPSTLQPAEDRQRGYKTGRCLQASPADVTALRISMATAAMTTKVTTDEV